jgi:hypothetical protein
MSDTVQTTEIFQLHELLRVQLGPIASIAIRRRRGYRWGVPSNRLGVSADGGAAMARDILSDAKLRSAKAAAKSYKLYDGCGLFLLVRPNGARYWRLKYRSAGREKLFAVGVYPEIGLADARARTLEARRLIRESSDPVVERRRQRSGAQPETFKAVAEEWIVPQPRAGPRATSKLSALLWLPISIRRSAD